MKKNVISLIKDFFYSTGSNLIGAVISALIVLVVPKFIEVEQYGYWQLAVFYFGYIGFFHLGWADGAYLRYGGARYEKLDKGIFKGQFIALTFLELFLSILISSFVIISPLDYVKKYIFIFFAAGCLFQLPGTFLRLMLQATGRIKEYSVNILVDKCSYMILLFLFIFSGARTYKILIFADILSRLLSTLHAIYVCRDIIFSREKSSIETTLNEAKENISSGSKLLFANLTSMLIIGIVRIGIEHTWDVATFGKVSLTLSISNFVMIFISAISMIIYPILRRTDSQALPKIYEVLSNIIMALIVGMLLVFFPFRFILSMWLPNYADSLVYMAILFPICLYEGKNTLLITTYLKAYRKEKILLIVNLISVIISFALTTVFTQVFASIYFTVLSIVIVLAFRCILSEILLSKYVDIKIYKSIICEFICTAIFIISASLIKKSIIGFLVYLIVYTGYLLINYKNLKQDILLIKTLIKE